MIGLLFLDAFITATDIKSSSAELTKFGIWNYSTSEFLWLHDMMSTFNKYNLLNY